MFLLFCGQSYYPGGGWEDYEGSFETIEEAVERVANMGGMTDWWHVVNLETGRIAKSGRR